MHDVNEMIVDESGAGYCDGLPKVMAPLEYWPASEVNFGPPLLDLLETYILFWDSDWTEAIETWHACLVQQPKSFNAEMILKVEGEEVRLLVLNPAWEGSGIPRHRFDRSMKRVCGQLEKEQYDHRVGVLLPSHPSSGDPDWKRLDPILKGSSVSFHLFLGSRGS